MPTLLVVFAANRCNAKAKAMLLNARSQKAAFMIQPCAPIEYSLNIRHEGSRSVLMQWSAKISKTDEPVAMRDMVRAFFRTAGMRSALFNELSQPFDALANHLREAHFHRDIAIGKSGEARDQ